MMSTIQSNLIVEIQCFFAIIGISLSIFFVVAIVFPEVGFYTWGLDKVMLIGLVGFCILVGTLASIYQTRNDSQSVGVNNN